MLKLAQEGFHVWGVDYSAGMLSIAEEKKKKLHSDISKRIHFIRANLCNVELSEKYAMSNFSDNSSNIILLLCDNTRIILNINDLV